MIKFLGELPTWFLHWATDLNQAVRYSHLNKLGVSQSGANEDYAIVQVGQTLGNRSLMINKIIKKKKYNNLFTLKLAPRATAFTDVHASSSVSTQSLHRLCASFIFYARLEVNGWILIQLNSKDSKKNTWHVLPSVEKEDFK